MTLTSIKAHLDYNQPISLLDSREHLYYHQGMIREYVCYKCECDKCGHSWTTKGNVIPKVCAKCHVVTWNENSAPVESPVSVQPVEKAVEAVPVVQDSVAAFIAQAQAKKGITQAPVTAPAEIAEEWQFTADRATHNGDIDVWLREQFLVSNPKKRRKVEVSEWDHNELVRII